jgi:hypothetical protein
VIEAADFLGNTSTLEIPVAPALPALDLDSAQGWGEGSFTLECDGTWLVATAAFTAPEAEAPVLEVDGPPSTEGGLFRRIDDRTFRAGYVPARPGRVALRAVHPRMPADARQVEVFLRNHAERTARFDGDVTLTSRSNSPYGALFVWSEPAPATSASGLRWLDGPYRLEPADSPIDEPVTISIPAPEGTVASPRVAVYRRSGGGWSREDTTVSGGRLTIRTRELGAYAVLADETPPALSGVKPSEGAVLKDRRPTISGAVSDGGSGVAEVSATCGDRWLLMAHDPEHGRALWERDEDLPAGEQTLEIRVTYRAGNAATVTRKLRIPPA